jgi:hypothetical protein
MQPFYGWPGTTHYSLRKPAFVIKFKDSTLTDDARLVGGLSAEQVSQDESGGSYEGHVPHRAAEVPEGVTVNNVMVKYVLISLGVVSGRCRKRTGGRAKDMFIISVNYQWNVINFPTIFVQITDALGEIA